MHGFLSHSFSLSLFLLHSIHTVCNAQTFEDVYLGPQIRVHFAVEEVEARMVFFEQVKDFVDEPRVE